MNVLNGFWREERMKNRLQELFYCEHLTDSSEHHKLIDGFKTMRKEGKGLEKYLKNCAVEEEVAGIARTYLVRDANNNELVGYFSLKAGSVTVNESRKWFITEFDSIPGIELANFAVNDAYRETHREFLGIGKIIFYYFIQPIAKDISSKLGAKFLYIFALPYRDLISYYRTMDFERLDKQKENRLHRRIKPRYDKSCVFMYQLIE